MQLAETLSNTKAGGQCVKLTLAMARNCRWPGCEFEGCQGGKLKVAMLRKQKVTRVRNLNVARVRNVKRLGCEINCGQGAQFDAAGVRN
jgi:hypothetical protein